MNDLVGYKEDDAEKGDDTCGDFQDNIVLHNDRSFRGLENVFLHIERLTRSKAPLGG
jgi:hypothetical protein